MCRIKVPTPDILLHFRLMHPEVDADEVEQWPDGKTVIYDWALEPEDFA